VVVVAVEPIHKLEESMLGDMDLEEDMAQIANILIEGMAPIGDMVPLGGQTLAEDMVSIEGIELVGDT